jgi:ferritin-like protein
VRILAAVEALAKANDDEAILQDLIRLEQRGAAGLFRDQAQAHVEKLSAALKDHGGTPPKRSVAAAPGNRQELLELETRTIAAYQDAARSLEDGELLKTLAAIMANHGQHLVVLREALGRDPVPGAFEPAL